MEVRRMILGQIAQRMMTSLQEDSSYFPLTLVALEWSSSKVTNRSVPP
jgi:hypothetical protein